MMGYKIFKNKKGVSCLFVLVLELVGKWGIVFFIVNIEFVDLVWFFFMISWFLFIGVFVLVVDKVCFRKR